MPSWEHRATSASGATTPLGENGKLAAWMREAGATSEAMFRSGIHPAGGARLAREQPAAQFLYQEIDGINAALDKMAHRKRAPEFGETPPDDELQF